MQIYFIENYMVPQWRKEYVCISWICLYTSLGITQQYIQYCFKLEAALFFSSLVVYTIVLNNTINSKLLSIAQANFSFKNLDMLTPMNATPTFITKALRIVTYVQLF